MNWKAQQNSLLGNKLNKLKLGNKNKTEITPIRTDWEVLENRIFRLEQLITTQNKILNLHNPNIPTETFTDQICEYNNVSQVNINICI